MITVGSLFSGIGGLDLGLEQAGMRTVWQVEYDDWARSKLEENFPNTEKFKDVREVGIHCLGPVDLICGGFPCQDVSKGGKKAGIKEGTRSGLWFEFRRVLSELRPRYALLENVTGLLDGGIGIVLGDLASLGYDAEWESLPAIAFGAPHLRDRVFIVAHLNGERSIYSEARRLATETRMQAFRDLGSSDYSWQLRGEAKSGWPFRGFEWLPEPDVARVVYGVPSDDDKQWIKSLGNAVCPPVAKWIGERIIEFDHNRPLETQDSRLDGGISND